MQFYSDYNLDLPVRIADRVIERITFEGLSYKTLGESSSKLDINVKRKTVTFRVWHEILIL